VAGKRLGADDERDLFPEVLRLAKEIQPDAIMIENVKGLLAKRFESYRRQILDELAKFGYWAEWRLFNASHFGVPQARMRSVLVGLRPEATPYFRWPEGDPSKIVTVGEALEHLMGANDWPGVKAWVQGANGIAPTLSGGSTKHGGADLGPSRTKQAWRRQGVDAYGLADTAPNANFTGDPKLTVSMAAVLQGFPEDWRISGRKTKAYRQVGNAFPPPVAEAVGRAIAKALTNARKAAGKAVEQSTS
jgi:DNA (cytosine-5)-methyltransferase 1